MGTPPTSIHTQTFDVIVIGAGAMGSAAAYHLAKDGQRVLLLEQFRIGHARGSSHGGSRIIRYAHESIELTRMMPATFDLWRQLEQESGRSLIQLTGGLYFGLASDPFFDSTQQALQTLGFPYQMLSANAVRQAFPQFRLRDEWVALEQAQTGIVAATRSVETMVAQAVRHGALVQEDCKVLAVAAEGDHVVVRIAGQGSETTRRARQVIITAGPWARQLLEPALDVRLPLTPTHQQIAYFAVEKPADYAIGRFPTYVFFDGGPGLYGFPIYEHPGYVKVAMELVDTPVDPDAVGVVDQEVLAQLSAAVADLLVGVNPQPALVETCRYTETPTRDFIIDRHPHHPQILFAAGFSGRGFKHAIAIGRLLADLAQSEPDVYTSEFWLPSFALNNFINKVTG